MPSPIKLSAPSALEKTSQEGLVALALEQQARLADHRINDSLLKELVWQFAKSERRIAELNELKNHFLGIAAHDLRNPLTTIMGMSKMLLELDLDEDKCHKFLESINRASIHMLGLVNDLLDISVIESGQFALAPKPANLARTANDRVELLELIAAQKNIRIETSIDDVPDTRYDADRIGQVIDNLLSNAIKFSAPETVVTLSVRRAGDGVEIAVADQGPGIPEDERDRLFGTFEKLSAKPTGGERSTGLGLSIVKKIVEAHEGTITIDSTVGKGSTFTVSLPNLVNVPG